MGLVSSGCVYDILIISAGEILVVEPSWTTYTWCEKHYKRWHVRMSGSSWWSSSGSGGSWSSSESSCYDVQSGLQSRWPSALSCHYSQGAGDPVVWSSTDEQLNSSEAVSQGNPMSECL